MNVFTKHVGLNETNNHTQICMSLSIDECNVTMIWRTTYVFLVLVWSEATISDQDCTGYTTKRNNEQGIVHYTPSQGEQGIVHYTPSQWEQGIEHYTPSQGEQGIEHYTPSQGELLLYTTPQAKEHIYCTLHPKPRRTFIVHYTLSQREHLLYTKPQAKKNISS